MAKTKNQFRGKFRRQLRPVEILLDCAPRWARSLEPLWDQYERGEIKAGEFATLYLLIGYRLMWCAGVSGPIRPCKREIPSPRSDTLFDKAMAWFEDCEFKGTWTLPREFHLGEFMKNAQIRGLRESSKNLLIRWLSDDLNLVLTKDIPSSIEMLNFQARGQRPVSTIIRQDLLGKVLSDDRDALSFFLHDVGHATHFLPDGEYYKDQVAIYQLLLRAEKSGLLAPAELKDSEWGERCEYLISDLNTHPLHYFSVFFATARECYLKDGELCGPGSKANKRFKTWRGQIYACWQLSNELIQDFEEMFVYPSFQASNKNLSAERIRNFLIDFAYEPSRRS